MSRLGMYIGIVLRLLRLGLLHKYLFWKARYGSQEARRRLLLAGYEYRLHQLLRRVRERYGGSVLILDIGSPPYEKARYARWYIGVDLRHTGVGVAGPEDYVLIEADISTPEGIGRVVEALEEYLSRHRPAISLATIDVEGNASRQLVDTLLEKVDMVILEVHPGSQEEGFIGMGRVIDRLPDGTMHVVLGRVPEDLIGKA